MAARVAPLDVAAALEPERAALLELLRGLSAEAWERPTECPAWNTKELALHILGDDLSLLARQRDASTNGLILFAIDHPGRSFLSLLDGFNEQWVAAARFFSSELVIELLGLAGEWSEAFYREVGLDTVSGEPVGFFAETDPSPYWQLIAREYVERFTHHAQIRRAVGAAELGGELVTTAAVVAVHALAAWMRDYKPATGSTIAVDFGAIGTWIWERDADRWSVLGNDADRAVAARIAVPSTASVALLSRGMTRADAAAVLTIDGDEALARGAIDIITPLLGQPAR